MEARAPRREDRPDGTTGRKTMADIVRWDPFRDIAALRSEMDRVFGRLAEQTEPRLPRRWAPVADIVETDDEIVITAELPGVKDEDIEITVEDGMLRIAGERRLEEELKEEHRYRLERTFGSFERTFPLPRGVKETDITAGVAYGVLRVRVPKPKAPQPTRIPIKGS
jgi:HSP20 family protein